ANLRRYGKCGAIRSARFIVTPPLSRSSENAVTLGLGLRFRLTKLKPSGPHAVTNDMEHVLQVPVTSITARIGAALRKRLEGSMANEDQPPPHLSRLLAQLESKTAGQGHQKDLSQTPPPARSNRAGRHD